MIDAMIKRVVKRLFPELTGGLHLPLWAVVVNYPTPIEESNTSSALEPLYAVDIRMLNDQGLIDETQPVFTHVPLPVNGAGNLRGNFGFPAKGALVEVGFIRGLPNKPFIRTVLIEGLTVPTLNTEELLIQQSGDCFQRATQEKNWERSTTQNIMDTSKNHTETIDDIKKSIAGLSQHIKVANGGTVYLGNDSENTLALISEFISIFESLSSVLASHTHSGVMSGGGTTTPPLQAGSMSGAGSQASGIKSRLDSFTE